MATNRMATTTTPHPMAAELARIFAAEQFGVSPADVAEQWHCYSEDVYRVAFVEPTPARCAQFVGWLIRAMVDASR